LPEFFQTKSLKKYEQGLEDTEPRRGILTLRRACCLNYVLSFRSARFVSRTALICIAGVALLLSPACLVRRHKIAGAARPNAPLLTATAEQLVQTVRTRYQAIETLNATVDLEPTVLSSSKGEVAEYKDVLGYILFRKPEWIRVVALYPVVRSTAFDMVSDGHNFRLYLPSKNLFLTGLNRIERPSPKKMENLRPDALLNALLIRPPDPDTERAVIENWTEGNQISYILHIIERQRPGRLRLARNLWFDRTTLEIYRQQIFDEQGDMVTDARYAEWAPYGDVVFPRQIVITRPKDEYELAIKFEKTMFNQPIGPEKFDLPEPPGVKVQRVGEDQETKTGGNTSG
jgi:outer membrane lipoprotein-sorting protein